MHGPNNWDPDINKKAANSLKYKGLSRKGISLSHNNSVAKIKRGSAREFRKSNNLLGPGQYDPQIKLTKPRSPSALILLYEDQ